MRRRGDYDEADDNQAAAADALELRRPPVPAAELPRDRFALADRQLCERVSAEHYAAARKLSGGERARVEHQADQWADLAARIQHALAGTYTTFTADDVARTPRGRRRSS
jgi:hypothetical protein